MPKAQHHWPFSIILIPVTSNNSTKWMFNWFRIRRIVCLTPGNHFFSCMNSRTKPEFEYIEWKCLEFQTLLFNVRTIHRSWGKWYEKQKQVQTQFIICLADRKLVFSWVRSMKETKWQGKRKQKNNNKRDIRRYYRMSES